MKTISFTGHRPQYLGGFTPEAKRRLYKFVHNKFLAIEDDAEIYFGCALGFDMAVGTAAIELGHKAIACLPYLGFNARWPLSSVWDLDCLLNKCHEVRIVTTKEEVETLGKEPAWLLNKRNHYMVDETDSLIALCCGAPSGTQNCIDYAHKQNKPVTYWWNDWLKFKERHS